MLFRSALLQGKAASEGTPERWKEALGAVRRAVASAEADDVPENIRSRAAKALADVEAAAQSADERSGEAARWTRLLRTLDEIDLASTEPGDAAALAARSVAFAEYGLVLEDGTPEVLAARIRGTAAPLRIAAALDEIAWTRKARALPDDRLRAIVAALDPDPVRTRIRSPRGPGELRKIASGDAAANFPVETALTLGQSLLRLDAVDEAIDVSAGLQRRFPGEFAAHVLHANALRAAGVPTTLGVVRDATTLVALRDDSPSAWTRLGAAFAAHGAFPEAESALKRALALDPKSASAKIALADVNAARGDWDAALAAAGEAVAVNPDSIDSQFALGRALRRRGRYADALAALRRGRELASKNPRPREGDVESVETVERLAALAGRIAELKAGRVEPADAGERLAWAQVCAGSGLYSRAADLYAVCLAEDPALTADFRREVRLDAACAAALAVPRPEGRPTALDEAQFAPRRRQAIDWLRADLDAWSANFAADPRLPAADVRRRFARWTEGPELAGLRDRAALAAMPDADRVEWTALWADVRGLLARARQ